MIALNGVNFDIFIEIHICKIPYSKVHLDHISVINESSIYIHI